MVLSMDKRTPFPRRSPILRWVDYARRSWQRVGHLRILCSLAHPGTRTNLEGLSKRFESVVTDLHNIPEGFQDRVSEYVRAYRGTRYRERRNLFSPVELQDLYLSDPLLPSQSGAITGDAATAGYRHAVYVEMPTWGVRLRLLRRDNYTLTDRGKVLRGLRENSRRRHSNIQSMLESILGHSWRKILLPLLYVGCRRGPNPRHSILPLATRRLFHSPGSWLHGSQDSKRPVGQQAVPRGKRAREINQGQDCYHHQGH